MQIIATPVTHRRRENADPCWLFPIEIIKNCAAHQIIADVFLDILAYSLKQRMSRRDPFRQGLLLQMLFVENHLSVFPTESPKLGLQPFADRPQVSWHPTDAKHIPPALRLRHGDPGKRRRLKEEILDHLRHESPLTC